MERRAVRDCKLCVHFLICALQTIKSRSRSPHICLSDTDFLRVSEGDFLNNDFMFDNAVDLEPAITASSASSQPLTADMADASLSAVERREMEEDATTNELDATVDDSFSQVYAAAARADKGPAPPPPPPHDADDSSSGSEEDGSGSGEDSEQEESEEDAPMAAARRPTKLAATWRIASDQE